MQESLNSLTHERTTKLKTGEINVAAIPATSEGALRPWALLSPGGALAAHELQSPGAAHFAHGERLPAAVHSDESQAAHGLWWPDGWQAAYDLHLVCLSQLAVELP